MRPPQPSWLIPWRKVTRLNWMFEEIETKRLRSVPRPVTLNWTERFRSLFEKVHDVAITETPGSESEDRPFGPRAAVRRQAILDAAIELLMEVGYDRMSMDALAERARAGKATIYRHWAGKAEVVVEAIRCRKCDDFAAPPDTGSVRGDLVAMLNHSRESFTEEDSGLLIGMVSAMHHDQELSDLMRQQMSEAKQGLYDEIVSRAVQRGEPVSMTAAPVVNEVCSALFFNRVAMGGGELDDAFIFHMVDDVILPLLRC
jgi:AcrR family transcriptional regulator